MTKSTRASFPSNNKIWDLTKLQTKPRTYPSDIRADGVRSLFIEGEPYQGKSTRVFAWIGMPPFAQKNKKTPAIILVHGGAGTAFAEWVRLWNSRGYAAIAMDLCGSVPIGSYEKWERHSQGGPAGWGDFANVNAPVSDQWIYHAVAAVIRSHTLLASLPEVDPNHIGITGISWGGFITCITAGLDKRLAFAAPVYGCGYLDLESVWLPDFEKMGHANAQKWLRLWDPSRYLKNIQAPVLWVTGTNDFAFPLNALQKSYQQVRTPQAHCIRLNMPHGHGYSGEHPLEILVFADAHCRSTPPLPKIVSQTRTKKSLSISYVSPFTIVWAELLYTTDQGPWIPRKWQCAPAQIDWENHKVRADIPEGTSACFINITDYRNCMVSSPHITLAR